MYLYQNYTSEFISEPTKYSKYYFLIIERALSSSRTKLKKNSSDYVYYENHHILPRSLFPDFSNQKENPWNSVLLTAREHYIIHVLIWKHFKSLNHSSQYKMAYVIKLFNGTNRYNSKHYNNFRPCLIHTQASKDKIRASRLGKSPSEDAKNKRLHTIHEKGYNMSLLVSNGLLALDSNGNTKAKNASLNALETKKSSIDEYGKNILQLQAEKRVKNMRNNIDDNGQDRIEIAITKMVETRSKINEDGKTSFQLGAEKGAITRAKHIQIYDNESNLMFDCIGNYTKICKEHNLPREQLSKSIKLGGTPIYNNLNKNVLNKIIRAGYYKCIGWYAILLN
jgi:hypothetical protein